MTYACSNEPCWPVAMKRLVVLVLSIFTGIFLIACGNVNDASELPEKETIVVASLYGFNQGVEWAIADFNKNNPKYKVVYKGYYDNTAEWSDTLYNDAVNTMKMDLVSDNPPDIIDLSSLNISTLADKGLLEDLYPYLEKSTVLKKEDFVPSVLKAYTYNDKLVTIPSGFTINTLIAKKSLVGDVESCTIEDLMVLSAKYPEADLMQFATKQTILSQFLQFNTKAFVNFQEGTCYFDTPEFIEILEFANTFEDEYEYGHNYRAMVQNNKILLDNIYLADMVSYKMHTLMMEEQFKDAMTPEYEKDETGDYKRDENGELIEVSRGTWNYYGWEAEIYACTQEDVDAVKKLIEVARPYDQSDEEIFAIISEEVTPFFQGQKSAQDVAKIIQNRVSIFISENS